MSRGVIYVLTNPSFPEYVKIGYADKLETRLAQLNQSECLPFAFRAYCIYEVEDRLKDKDVHALIDQLNPGLRAIEEFDGKPRVREFYNMSPEEAYDILRGIATVSGTIDRLKKVKPEGHEVLDENLATKIQDAFDTKYTEGDHFEHSTAATKSLYLSLKKELMKMEGVFAEPKKLYIAFKTASNICDVEIRRSKLKVTINVLKGQLKDPQNLTEDVSEVGHWGNGDYQFELDKESDIPYLVSLVKQSYYIHAEEH